MDINYKNVVRNAVIVFLIGVGYPLLMFVVWGFIRWKVPVLNEFGQAMVYPWIRAWILIALLIGVYPEVRNS